MKKLLFSVVLFAASFSLNSQVGIGTTTPHVSAALEIKSSDKALLITRVASTSDVNPATNGMIVYVEGVDNCFKAFQNGSWSDCFGSSGGGGGGGGGTNTTDNTSCDFVTTVVPIVSPFTNRTWMDRDLGATQKATNFDSSLDMSHWYYQWGRGSDCHQLPTSDYIRLRPTTITPSTPLFISLIDENDVKPSQWLDHNIPEADMESLWQNGLNDPCTALNSDYEVPSAADWQAEIDGVSFNGATVVGKLDSYAIGLTGLALTAGAGTRRNGVELASGTGPIAANLILSYDYDGVPVFDRIYNEFGYLFEETQYSSSTFSPGGGGTGPGIFYKSSYYLHRGSRTNFESPFRIESDSRSTGRVVRCIKKTP